jgi:hypothetical protein
VRQRRFGSCPRTRTRSWSAPGSVADDRPVDAPFGLADQPDRGPGELEVVELLGVDEADRLGVERAGHEAQRGRRGLTGVVPPLERGDEHGPAQPRPALEGRVLHPPTMPSFARAVSGAPLSSTTA